MIVHSLLAVFIGVLALPSFGLAHGSGQSFETMTDAFLVDIGFDEPFQVGEEILLDFALYTVKDGEPDSLANFTNLTVSIHSGSTVQWTRSIDKPEFGKVFATMAPKREGQWTLTADFFAGETRIESASFAITILPPSDTSADVIPDSVLFVVIVTILAVASFFVFMRLRHLFS